MRVALSFSGCHRRGGVERVLVECANFLVARGHETHVFASEWDPAALAQGVVRHHVPVGLRPSWLRLPLFSFQSRRRLRDLRPPPDVLGSFGVQSPPGGVLWVTSVHRAWIDISRRRRSLSGRLKQRLNPFHPVVLALERYQIEGRRYRKLIALTEQVKADLISLYRVPAADVEVIPNGFSPSEFNIERRSRNRARMRERLGYEADQHVVIFVANELERKGFGPLLRAAASMDDDRLRLLVVGRVTPHRYQDVIDRLGMTEKVRFTGPTSEVADYFGAADSFALPTQYEAWGLVIVEALACGLPVLTSKLAGAAVAVREGETGYLLDEPEDVDEIREHLRRLIAGRHADPSMISESVSRFAWSSVLPAYERVLVDAVEARA